ncbi:hypothetical protein E4L65_11505, partial [Burkholderia pseudomallei]|nr:hypothetical protein [Burkholderia pseudomallei]
VGRRAPAVPRLRWAGLRRALGGAWCPPAVGHGGGAPSDGHHVFMHRSSLIAHRAGGGRAPHARLHAFDSCAGLANRRVK